MPTHLLRAALCLLLLALIAESAIAADTVRVTRVTGVDVFETDDGRTIGLLGITSPNARQTTITTCTAHLKSLIEGKVVVLVADTTVEDVEGKTPQRLVYLGSTLVNLQMISDGYARPSSTQHLLAGSFSTAHATARSSQVGTYKPTSKATNPPSSSTRESSASQCTGRTKSGRRCRRMTTSSSGRCWQH